MHRLLIVTVFAAACEAVHKQAFYKELSDIAKHALGSDLNRISHYRYDFRNINPDYVSIGHNLPPRPLEPHEDDYFENGNFLQLIPVRNEADLVAVASSGINPVTMNLNEDFIDYDKQSEFHGVPLPTIRVHYVEDYERGRGLRKGIPVDDKTVLSGHISKNDGNEKENLWLTTDKDQDTNWVVRPVFVPFNGGISSFLKEDEDPRSNENQFVKDLSNLQNNKAYTTLKKLSTNLPINIHKVKYIDGVKKQSTKDKKKRKEKKNRYLNLNPIMLALQGNQYPVYNADEDVQLATDDKKYLNINPIMLALQGNQYPIYNADEDGQATKESNKNRFLNINPLQLALQGNQYPVYKSEVDSKATTDDDKNKYLNIHPILLALQGNQYPIYNADSDGTATTKKKKNRYLNLNPIQLALQGNQIPFYKADEELIGPNDKKLKITPSYAGESIAIGKQTWTDTKNKVYPIISYDIGDEEAREQYLDKYDENLAKLIKKKIENSKLETKPAGIRPI